MTPISVCRNGAGGVDLITDMDAGNSVLIQTGNRECSQEFWETMIDMSKKALYEMQKDDETDDETEDEQKCFDIDSIDDKVTFNDKLTEDERNFLISGIFATHLKSDDPKYDDSNSAWLDGMTDKELLDKYYS